MASPCALHSLSLCRPARLRSRGSPDPRRTNLRAARAADYSPGQGLKHREIPLVQEARDPLETYFTYREHLAEQWRGRAAVRGESVASWSRWPDGHLFLGQRGPLAERGIRAIIAKLGQTAKLTSPLGPHDLRHTLAKALLDLAAYGLDRPPMPLPAIQQLLGHADIATTTIYTRVSADDLARMMGTSEAL